jgi:hypothetical protein
MSRSWSSLHGTISASSGETDLNFVPTRSGTFSSSSELSYPLSFGGTADQSTAAKDFWTALVSIAEDRIGGAGAGKLYGAVSTCKKAVVASLGWSQMSASCSLSEDSEG